jgi:hypothetical protein
MIGLDGDFIWLEDYVNRINISRVETVPVEFAGYFVIINGTEWETVTKGCFEWDWRTGQNYMEFTNGTRVYLQYDSATMCSWYFERDGKRYYVDWPNEYYLGNYSGSTIIVPGWLRRTWYYTLTGSERMEVPYSGVSSENTWLSWWSLGRIKSEGGVVPTDDYALVNGSLYLVHYYENLTDQGYMVVDGGLVNVTRGTGLYSRMLGEDVWDIKQIGFTMFLSNLTESGVYDLDHATEVYVSENYYYYGPDNITFTLLNGTSLAVQRRLRVMFYLLDINGTQYYVANYRPFYNHTTGTQIFYLLNGSRVELPMSAEYQIVRAITKDLGLIRWPAPTNFTWLGETYNTTLMVDQMMQICLWYSYYLAELNSNLFEVVPLSVIERTFMPCDTLVPREQYLDTYSYGAEFAIYNVTLGNGTTCLLYPKLEHVKMIRPSWGYPYGWHLQEFPCESISMRKQTWNIIVGAPEWGMWGFRRFTVVPETGALDLDGNLDTTDDQFYVKRVYVGGYNHTETRQGMDVHVMYDPNPVIPQDELTVNTWMGISKNSYRNTWNETYFWYYPNMTAVSPATMSLINGTIWNAERGTPNPGYWDISRMTMNMTWDDYVRKAKQEGWSWVETEATWTWLWFGLDQSYWASKTVDNETFQSSHVRLRYEYAGMFIYNDTNGNTRMDEGEATHYFMPKSVGNVTFITPGVALGDYNYTGMLTLPANRSIEFGVSYQDINGTMFPFGRSYYAWYGEDVSGTDLKTFTERPVGAQLDELSFKTHFSVENSTETNSTEARIKIDQHVDEWTLELSKNIAVLENLSLSLNYYVYTEMGGSWSIKTVNGTSIDPNSIMDASKLTLDASGLKFADINMGETYLWGGNLTMPYNISSYTVPLNTFVSTYTNYGSETSIGGWSFQSTMCFLSVGFPKWDGRYVYEDPEVIVYLGSEKQALIGSPEDFLPGWNPVAMQYPPGTSPLPGDGGQPVVGLPPMLIVLGFVVAAVAIVSLVFLGKRKKN